LLYIALQSPLSNPTKLWGTPRRNNRILAFDTVSERVVAEYAYRPRAGNRLRPNRAAGRYEDLGHGGAGPGKLLVLERTDPWRGSYLVDLTPSYNILAAPGTDPTTTPSFEALDDPAAVNLTVCCPRRWWST